MIFKGLKIYKADTVRGEQARWSRVEHTEMLLSQEELYQIVDQNADLKSAASQYHELPEALKMLVKNLVQYYKADSPGGQWSCACVRKYESGLEIPSDSQERERLVVILLLRPKNRTRWQTTPMGTLMDFESHLPSFDEKPPSETSASDLEMDERDGEEASLSGV